MTVATKGKIPKAMKEPEIYVVMATAIYRRFFVFVRLFEMAGTNYM